MAFYNMDISCDDGRHGCGLADSGGRDIKIHKSEALGHGHIRRIRSVQFIFYHWKNGRRIDS